jgi:hypothetical protein
MKRRRLEALERLLLRPQPTCRCLLGYCPQLGETRPLLDVVCDDCGLWRDPQTTQILAEIVVSTREEFEAFLAEERRQKR